MKILGENSRLDGLQFIEGGPKLPFELISSQEEGQVVFLCGAGVSMGPPVWFPDFKKLVEDIYKDLNEDYMLHPAEREGMDCDPRFLAPDRTLNALFRRLKPQRDRVMEALRKALETNHDGTRFHENLLKLSRGSNGNIRLITTNFDTLFERSWLHFSGQELESHAASGMPNPGAYDWQGVFHLHGRLADDMIASLTESQLVLTSAEFGDAYLRTGWASRYLYDLLRHTNVVIIGYSLNDPPLRYLIDALDADRDRFDFKSLYAIAPVQNGNENDTEAIWIARGTTPLLYNPVNPKNDNSDHVVLRKTIEAWAAYADDPTAWSRAKVRSSFRKSFTDIDEQEWSEINWILGRQDSGRVLEEANPTSRWLPKLLEGNASRRRPLSLGRWISRRLDDRDMMDAVLAHRSALTPDTCRQIESTILRDPSKLSSTRRAFWLALIDSAPSDKHGLGETSYRAKRLLGATTDRGFFAKKAISDWFRPSLTLDRRFQSGDRRGQKLTDIAGIEFQTKARQNDAAEVMSKWPPKHDDKLLIQLSSDLDKALSERLELNPHGLSSVFELPSVADHPQNVNRRGFAPLIRLIISLCERLATSSADIVREVVARWKSSDHEIERRMWLHCLRLPCFDPRQVAEALIELSDQYFWFVGYEREVMQLIINRWPDVSPSDQTAIEQRLIKGPQT